MATPPVWLEGAADQFAGAMVSAADVDGDGLDELAVGGRDSVWTLSPPYASGSLDAAADWTAPIDAYVAVLLPDVTGDGTADLAVQPWPCSAAVHAGPFVAGGPTAPVAVAYFLDLGESFTTCGDQDGDGDEELCLGTDPNCSVAGEEPTARVYASPLPSGYLDASAARVELPSLDGYDLRVGSSDLDGDGNAEIVLSSPGASGDGEVWLVRDPAPGTFDLGQADARWIGAESGDAGAETARGDLDGDGREDLVIAAPRWGAGYYSQASGRVFVALDEAGGPLVDLPITLRSDQPDGEVGTGVAVGDLDGDGNLDLAVSAPIHRPPSAGEVALFLGPLPLGTSTWADAAVVVSGWGANDYYGLDVALAELDGDGRADLVSGGTGDRGWVSRAGAVHLVFCWSMFP